MVSPSACGASGVNTMIVSRGRGPAAKLRDSTVAPRATCPHILWVACTLPGYPATRTCVLAEDVGSCGSRNSGNEVVAQAWPFPPVVCRCTAVDVVREARARAGRWGGGVVLGYWARDSSLF